MTGDADISCAHLQWDAQGQPISSQFGDIYFTTGNGLEETRHVFLHHNQLRERWVALGPCEHFSIAETGFGSGLNFLAAWELWLTTAPASAQLHFISVEKYPLNSSDLTRALALWPILADLAAQLTASYPCIIGSGFHRLSFMGGRIKLTLIIDDAAVGFTKLLTTTHPLFAAHGPKVDAWFLDGFAPAKNPEMWSAELFAIIAKLSKPGTTAATFSAAAIVKNGLRQRGFSVQKVAGFGRKREMVKSVYLADTTPALKAEDYSFRGSFSPYPAPWTVPANPARYNSRHAIVIGGGLAGCHSARALAERGWQVTLLERQSQLAGGGSGNPQGVVYAKLSPLNEAQAAFNLASLQYALRHYQGYWQTCGSRCGLLQLAHKPAESRLHDLLRERFANAAELVEFVTAERASHISGTPISYSGIYFPQAGWLNPRKLCADLTNHPHIQVLCQFNAVTLEQPNEKTGLWQVMAANKLIASASVVIVANAADALDLAQVSHLPIKAIRGQVTYLPQVANSPSLNTVVCAEGYISPASEGRYCSGATFNLKDAGRELRDQDHLTNLNNLHQYLPDLAQHWQTLDISALEGRVGFRCTLPDYLPAVGPAPIVEDLIRDFAPLRKNARAGITTTGSYFQGLYINIGYGARALAYTPLCAELLAAQINLEPLPMAAELANALNPARFIIRDLIKNKS